MVTHWKKEKSISSTDKNEIEDDTTAKDTGERPDNIWDIDYMTLSRKDNVAFRAKLFLSQVEMGNLDFDERVDGLPAWIPEADSMFDFPKYFDRNEAWVNILNNLWSAVTYDEINPNSSEDSDYGIWSKNSIRGIVYNRARSDRFFRALHEKLNNIEDDIQLQTQILAAVKSFKYQVEQYVLNNPREFITYDEDDYLYDDDEDNL